MKNFTLSLTLLLVLLLTATRGRAQTTYSTVAIIGSATANGWTTSTPMTAGTGTKAHEWTITLPLVTGEVKFRANNTWDVNWGSGTFPSGTGTANGSNIPVAVGGSYSVVFNDLTGAYLFTKQTTTANQLPQADLLRLALTPNPAHAALRVAYELPAAATATIMVLNALGQPVRQLTAVRQAAGAREQQLSLQGLGAGLYVVRLQAGNQTQTARLLVE